MEIELAVDLDSTLGCGQAHRWIKRGGNWEGVLGDSVVTMTQMPEGVRVEGDVGRDRVMRYLRADDDLDAMIADISSRDPYVADLSKRCPGLRLLRQDRWECLATYLLATNANVARIMKMVESVCDLFGTDLGPRRTFPTPKQILDGCDRICECRLGFREGRFVELAEKMENGEIDLDAIAEMDYRGCVEALKGIKGVGPKVADCVALFAFDHLCAFPVDVRIAKSVEKLYGVSGSYTKVSSFGMGKFGEYAGYAQELLYHSDFIS